MPPRKIQDPKMEALLKNGTANPHPDSVQDPSFKQSDFFDPRDLLQVKYEMLRCVRAEGRSVAEAAERYGVSRPTYYKAQSDFDRAGLVGLLPAKRGPRHAHKVTDEVMKLVEQILDEDADIDSTKLVARIERDLGIHIHRRTIERALMRKKKKLQGENNS